jgi:hypothetical protein
MKSKEEILKEIDDVLQSSSYLKSSTTTLNLNPYKIKYRLFWGITNKHNEESSYFCLVESFGDAIDIINHFSDENKEELEVAMKSQKEGLDSRSKIYLHLFKYLNS